jgi:hypothetical protein
MELLPELDAEINDVEQRDDPHGTGAPERLRQHQIPTVPRDLLVSVILAK